MKISIVIPAYNEERRIGDTLRKIISYLKLHRYIYEIIIVDDGSTDDTLLVISRFKDKKIKVIKCLK